MALILMTMIMNEIMMLMIKTVTIMTGGRRAGDGFDDGDDDDYD